MQLENKMINYRFEQPMIIKTNMKIMYNRVLISRKCIAFLRYLFISNQFLQKNDNPNIKEN